MTCTFRALYLLTAFSLCALIAFASIARADIIQPTANNATSYANNSSFGQSFTATSSDTGVSVVSMKYWAAAPASGVGVSILATLYTGQGYGGTLLGTTPSQLIPSGTPDESWVDFSFASAIPLTSGAQYTVRFTPTFSGSSGNGFYRYGVNSTTDIYTGGWQLNNAGGLENGGNVKRDLAFRVLVSPVPEPAAISLFAIAGVGMLLLRTRR